MSYSIEISPSCLHSIEKASKKIPVLKEALEKKMNEILENPAHYKPLRNELAGIRRVHILKSFVLLFSVDEFHHMVHFIAFEHHDDAYTR